MGEHSFTIVLPKKYANNMGISKGNSVSITQNQDALIIQEGIAEMKLITKNLKY